MILGLLLIPDSSVLDPAVPCDLVPSTIKLSHKPVPLFQCNLMIYKNRPDAGAENITLPWQLRSVFAHIITENQLLVHGTTGNQPPIAGNHSATTGNQPSVQVTTVQPQATSSQCREPTFSTGKLGSRTRYSANYFLLNSKANVRMSTRCFRCPS